MNADDTNYKGAEIYVLRGLPRAGKSTLSKDYSNMPIVSRDSIRLALHGSHWNDELEPQVNKIWKTMINALLFSGHRSIMLDGCFVKDEYVDWVRKEWPDAQVFEYTVNTPPEVCKQRAIDCGQDYLISVIDKFVSQASESMVRSWREYSEG